MGRLGARYVTVSPANAHASGPDTCVDTARMLLPSLEESGVRVLAVRPDRFIAATDVDGLAVPEFPAGRPCQMMVSLTARSQPVLEVHPVRNRDEQLDRAVARAGAEMPGERCVNAVDAVLHSRDRVRDRERGFRGRGYRPWTSTRAWEMAKMCWARTGSSDPCRACIRRCRA